jgi:hypothetical protein
MDPVHAGSDETCRPSGGGAPPSVRGRMRGSLMVKKVLKDATLLSVTAVALPLALLPLADGYARWRSDCLTSWGRQEEDRNGHIGERETKMKGARRHVSCGSVRRRAVIPAGRGTTHGLVAGMATELDTGGRSGA